MTNKIADYDSSVGNRENNKQTIDEVKAVKRFERIDPEPNAEIARRLFQKYIRETTLIFLHRHIFLRTMRDANANIIDDDDEHDCIMLNNEEGWNRNAQEGFKLKDFYLIHHLAINIPDLHFLKSEVEDASHNLKDPSEYAYNEILVNQIEELFLKLQLDCNVIYHNKFPIIINKPTVFHILFIKIITQVFKYKHLFIKALT